VTKGSRIAVCLAAAFLLLPATAPAATYRVRAGDTLTGIARHYHVNLFRLAHFNHRGPYGVLAIGTALRIPNHRGHHAAHHRRRHRRHSRAQHRRVHIAGRYTVRYGDTLSGIAARYSTSISALAAANNLNPADILLTGVHLRIPGRHRRAPSRAPGLGPGTAWEVQRLIDYWSVRDGISRHLCRAVAWMESGYHPGAVSSVGAWGVMQVMPATWHWVEWRLIGQRVPRTTSGNIRIGIAYLRQLLRDFHGDVRLALASYYQGEGAVRQIGMLPVTRAYVADILALSRRM
jgi:LysM repeat protein